MTETLPAPSRSNGYAVTSGHKITAALFQAVFSDVHTWLTELNQISTDYDSLVNDLTDQAVAAIVNSADPTIEQLRVKFAEAAASIAEIEDSLLVIQNGGIDASSVVLEPIEGFVPTDAQAAIADLLALIKAEVKARQTAISAMPTRAQLAYLGG